MTVALWCVLVAGFLPMLAGLVAKTMSPGYDNNNPRVFLSGLTGAAARANAAMQNGYEGFPLFAAAVLTAHLLKGAQPTADLLAVGYIISRIVYTVVYIKGWGALRSAVWAGGITCVVWLFIISM